MRRTRVFRSGPLMDGMPFCWSVLELSVSCDRRRRHWVAYVRGFEDDGSGEGELGYIGEMRHDGRTATELASELARCLEMDDLVRDVARSLAVSADGDLQMLAGAPAVQGARSAETSGLLDAVAMSEASMLMGGGNAPEREG